MSESAVLEKLELILARLETVEQRLQRLEGSAENMDTHIDFVTTVYQRVQAPFHALMGLTQRTLGRAALEEAPTE